MYHNYWHEQCYAVAGALKWYAQSLEDISDQYWRSRQNPERDGNVENVRPETAKQQTDEKKKSLITD